MSWLRRKATVSGLNMDIRNIRTYLSSEKRMFLAIKFKLWMRRVTRLLQHLRENWKNFILKLSRGGGNFLRVI